MAIAWAVEERKETERGGAVMGATVCPRCRKPITPGVNVVPFFPLHLRPKDTATTVYRFARVEGSKGRSALLTIPLRRNMVERKEGEEFSGLEKVLIDVLVKALVREINEVGLIDNWTAAEVEKPKPRRRRATR